jgi:hypothetical protein
MVLSETGYRVIINNGGGIYRLQRGGKRCELDSTISEHATINGADTIYIDNIYTQQSSQQDLEKSCPPLPNSPYRSHMSLCSSGSQTRESENQGHQWEELASGPADEALTNKLPQSIERKNWPNPISTESISVGQYAIDLAVGSALAYTNIGCRNIDHCLCWNTLACKIGIRCGDMHKQYPRYRMGTKPFMYSTYIAPKMSLEKT